MKYIIDHDLHIHTNLSPCAHDPQQTTRRLLRYAEVTGLSTICVTDHYWDDLVPATFDDLDWYAFQNHELIASVLPLPQKEGIRFLFGCETELDKNCRLGISEKRFDDFDFVIIPTTHLHLEGITVEPGEIPLERRAEMYVQRLDRVLSMDLPFRKIGIAHLTCSLLANQHPGDYLKVLDRIDDGTFRELFGKMAALGAGFELNFPLTELAPEDRERELRPYRIAKSCGCKFYLGSDAHTLHGLLPAPANFRAIVDALELEESDKFRV